jgi:hypothetical protein
MKCPSQPLIPHTSTSPHSPRARDAIAEDVRNDSFGLPVCPNKGGKTNTTYFGTLERRPTGCRVERTRSGFCIGWSAGWRAIENE